MVARKALPILALFAALFLIPSAAAGASNVYPSVGKLVDALANELPWLGGSSTEDRIVVLRQRKIIPSHFTSNQPATPTVILALARGLVERSLAGGDEPSVELSP